MILLGALVFNIKLLSLSLSIIKMQTPTTRCAVGVCIIILIIHKDMSLVDCVEKMIVLLYRYGRLKYIELCGFSTVIFQTIFDRAQIAQRRVHTFPIVKQLHVFENISLNFFKCNIFPAVNAFLFYRGKEALSTGIIIRAFRSAHAAADTDLPIAPVAVLAAPVAVKYESGNIGISGQSI